MTILTADVRDIACLFFEQVVQFVDNASYGIKCDEDDLLKDITKTLKHYEFNCWYDDYIRETVEDNSDIIPATCNRHTFEETIDT